MPYQPMHRQCGPRFARTNPLLLGAPFAPGVLPSITLWQPFDDATLITQSAGLVSQARGKTPTSFNSNQATGANQPAYITAAQNGKNGLRYSGSPVSMTIDPALVASSTAYSAFVIWNPGQTDFSHNYGGFYIAPSILLNPSWGGTTKWGAFRNAGFAASSFDVATGGAHFCLMIQTDATHFGLYTDGNAPEFFTGAALTSLTVSTVGTDQFNQQYIGDFYEIGYAPVAWGSSDIANLLAYSRSKWGTP